MTQELASQIHAFMERHARSAADAGDESVRRTQIMETALEIAAGEGVRGASLRRIAARLSMRTASLYSYFPGGKDELVGTATIYLMRGFYSFVARDLRPDDDPAENLRRLVFAHTRWTLSHPQVTPVVNVIERTQAISPVMSPDIESQIREMHASYRQLLRAILAELNVPPADAYPISELIILVGDGVDTWSGPGERSMPLADTEEFAWLICRRMLGRALLAGDQPNVEG